MRSRDTTHRPAYEILFPGGGEGGLQLIEFTILSVNEVELTAVVQVDARPCGKTSVTDEDSYDQLTVHDPQGCNLNEPEGDLIGRKGWAVRMTNNYTDMCQWDVLTVCCPDCT